MKSVIVIPARYGSTRLPRKPLQLISGKTMLERVIHQARQVTSPSNDPIDVIVATDHESIAAKAQEFDVMAVMTSEKCHTGTDRVYEAVGQLSYQPDFIINLQGDAPLTPPSFIQALLQAFQDNPQSEIVTPVTRLSWKELDTLRENKKTTPFSGTTAIVDSHAHARWFSKQIIPALRNEADLRAQSTISPVYGHVGLYGYSSDTLKRFVSLPPSPYEQLEGLEQLRALENGINITAVTVSYDGLPRMSGVDSPEDVIRIERLIADYGLDS